MMKDVDLTTRKNTSAMRAIDVRIALTNPFGLCLEVAIERPTELLKRRE
jgi:hypothetical protein